MPITPPLPIVKDDLSLPQQSSQSTDCFESVTARDSGSSLAQVHCHQPAALTMGLGSPPCADDLVEGVRLLEQSFEVEPATLAIQQYRRPGIEREPINSPQGTTILADIDWLSCGDRWLPAPADSYDIGESSGLGPRTVRKTADGKAIGGALARGNRNTVKAAEMRGVSRPTPYDLMWRLAIRPPAVRNARGAITQ